MNILLIFLLGFAILSGAILLNILASYIGLNTWYQFVQDYKQANLVDYVWLFVVYPFLLGVIAYFTSKPLGL